MLKHSATFLPISTDEPRAPDKLQAAVCDQMVMIIVARDQAEEEEEEESDNMDLGNNKKPTMNVNLTKNWK